MKNGVPFAAAFGIAPGEPVELDDEERMALAIVLAEMEGREFDWDAGAFRPQENK